MPEQKSLAAEREARHRTGIRTDLRTILTEVRQIKREVEELTAGLLDASVSAPGEQSPRPEQRQ